MLDIKELLSGDIQRMSHILRYSSYPIIRRENVAEHSWYVALYALAIGMDINKNTKLDMNLLLSKAILHDIDESLTGDFVHSFKYSVSGLAETIHEACKCGVVGMIRRLTSDKWRPLYDLWNRSKDKRTLEGCIVQLSDYLSVVAYCLQEYKLGNQTSKTILHECDISINTFFWKVPLSHRSVLRPYFDQVWEIIKSVQHPEREDGTKS